MMDDERGHSNREQCYLCIMALVPSAQPEGPAGDAVRREHKNFLASLESRGLLFGAGKFVNTAEEEASDFGVGMFILRSKSREEATAIASQEPYTRAGYRTMRLIPWQRTEGDITMRINFTNGTLTVDRRSFDLVARDGG
jgi:uncharacterized protein YciI